MSEKLAVEIERRMGLVGIGSRKKLAEEAGLNRGAVHSWLERGRFARSLVLQLCRGAGWNATLEELDAFDPVWVHEGKARLPETPSVERAFTSWDSPRHRFEKAGRELAGLQIDLLARLREDDCYIYTSRDLVPSEWFMPNEGCPIRSALRRGVRVVYLMPPQKEVAQMASWFDKKQLSEAVWLQTLSSRFWGMRNGLSVYLSLRQGRRLSYIVRSDGSLNPPISWPVTNDHFKYDFIHGMRTEIGEHVNRLVAEGEALALSSITASDRLNLRNDIDKQKEAVAGVVNMLSR